MTEKVTSCSQHYNVIILLVYSFFYRDSNYHWILRRIICCYIYSSVRKREVIWQKSGRRVSKPILLLFWKVHTFIGLECQTWQLRESLFGNKHLLLLRKGTQIGQQDNQTTSMGTRIVAYWTRVGLGLGMINVAIKWIIEGPYAKEVRGTCFMGDLGLEQRVLGPLAVGTRA